MKKRIHAMKVACKPHWSTYEEGKRHLISTFWIPSIRKRAVILHDELPF